VSPAGGNFDEPVTQATLKVVGAFHGLSRARSDARRYPAIDPLDSWSKYVSVVDTAQVEHARGILRRGNEVGQMMKVVGEEGTSIDDFVLYLKAEYLDAVYLQQDAYHAIDGETAAARQRHVFAVIDGLLRAPMRFQDKTAARRFFHGLTQVTRDWNRVAFDSPEFKRFQETAEARVAEVTVHA
jgi:V/A-type H+-transporting ATPase subunit A